ncbi:uncharacterized protein CXorf65 homolog isoform X1 [Pseudophryne corroboree]|uniref:uncharacterized protein CXorf65 homolog isoform X1 n=1 Tax=Pseudophryne corroboree TaxID=495146 RepID=UPI0030818639
MFICIVHGDKQQFLVNISCNVIHLLDHIRKKLQVPVTDTIDLCDIQGSLQFFCFVRNFAERADKYVSPRETYYVCKIEKGEPGSKYEHCYREITLLLSSPEPEITDALRAQCEFLEKSRPKLLKDSGAKWLTALDLRKQLYSALPLPTSHASEKSSEEEMNSKQGNARSPRDKAPNTLRKNRHR